MKFQSLLMLAVTIAGTAMISAACQAPSPPTQETAVSPAQAQNTDMPDAPTSDSNAVSESYRRPEAANQKPEAVPAPRNRKRPDRRTKTRITTEVAETATDVET